MEIWEIGVPEWACRLFDEIERAPSLHHNTTIVSNVSLKVDFTVER
jgi:hypothetical protein